ncbi:N-acyl amino acid synthase FeeM domain-containing protein [Sporosarcina limicola]
MNLKAIVVKDKEKLNEIYKLRYDTFVVEQQSAPISFYPNGLLKDDIDSDGFHIGCYLNEELVGCITLIKKENKPLMAERIHQLRSFPNNIYAEVMRLIIVENPEVNNFGVKAKVLGELLERIKEIVVQEQITHIYLQSTKSSQKIYESLGFEQIGSYKMYEGISNECPMLLDINNTNNRIFKEE